MKKEWYCENRKKAIEEWKDLKYGMFIHFGLYSLCGGYWKGEKVTRGYSEQILSHGNVAFCDYEALKEEFSIEHFNADEIALLAKEAKMSYIVLVTKHHDGFCLFNTKTTSYNSVNSACKRDIVKEISQACQRHGLKLGLYFSWIDWHCVDALPISSHNSDRIPPLHMKYNLAQLEELLTGYGDICELWMDMGNPTPEQSSQVRELALRLQPNIMINGRVWNDMGDFLTMGDNQFPDCALSLPWQTPATIYHETWGYREWQERTDFEEKVETINKGLHYVVENGGNYLLNIGPKGDGSLVDFEVEVLKAVGKEIENAPLERKPIEATPLVVDNANFTLLNGEKVYRYTGSEYYTFHPIVTGLNYTLALEEDGVYEFSYLFDLPLQSEIKLALETDNDTLIFPLKENKKECLVCSRLKLKKGINHISIVSCGNPIRREEIKNLDIKLNFKRV